jgi:hypothetical protein
MVRCPSCGSFRVFVIVAAERRTRCIECGSAWSRPVSIDEDIRRDLGTATHGASDGRGRSDTRGEANDRFLPWDASGEGNGIPQPTAT